MVVTLDKAAAALERMEHKGGEGMEIP